MQISKNVVASIEYELTADGGEVIDSSKGGPPLAYLHGNGNLIPGLEAELEGKGSGDSVKVRIAPENAYGPRNEDMVQPVPRSDFPADADLQPGMQFQAQTPDGMLILTIVEIDGDTVKLDGNHPLAGMHLNFDVTVIDVREATAEELENGHVQGPGEQEQ